MYLFCYKKILAFLSFAHNSIKNSIKTYIYSNHYVENRFEITVRFHENSKRSTNVYLSTNIYETMKHVYFSNM